MPDPKRMCRTCRWLITGGGRIYKTHAYPCNWPLPPLPDSITKSYGLSTARTRMMPDGGKNCPTWEKRDA